MSVDHHHTPPSRTADRDTPFAELIDGFNEVRGEAIPYERLPRRARTFYSDDFARWSDLAGETINSLVARPKGGEATVHAIVSAAEDAVAAARSRATGERQDPVTAVALLLDRLTEFDRALLTHRVWTWPPVSKPELAHRLGVHAASVSRNQPRAEARYRELLADPAHRDVLHHAGTLGRRLGPLAPHETVGAELRELRLQTDSDAARVLLHIAGPYIEHGSWWENTAADGRRRVESAVDAVFTRDPAPSTATLTHELGALGVPRTTALTYLQSRPDLRRDRDIWVRWGASAAARAEAVLHARGEPTSADDIIDAIAAAGDAYSPRAVREALYAEHRFVRVTRRTWALREWDLDEYGGVFDAVAARIDAADGPVSTAAIIRDVKQAFPDVAESSIRTFFSARAFVNVGGALRRRTAQDPWPAAGPLNEARGAFRHGDSEIRLAVPVTSEILRGSGQRLHAAVATAIGIHAAQRRKFSGPHGDVEVHWRLSSTTGPSIGSLRAHAVAVGAEVGDTLLLTLSTDNDSISAERIGADVTGAQRLQQLLGRAVDDAVEALAVALECEPADVAPILRERGDGHLLL